MRESFFADLCQLLIACPEMLPFLYKRLLLSKAAPLTAYRAMSTAMKQLPNGAYPTMITPFLDDDKKSVDWNTLDSKALYIINMHRI